MARSASLAEHYRRHRAAMELALEMNVTPREAEQLLRAREGREHLDALRKRRDTPLEPAPAPRLTREIDNNEPGDRPAPWWLRD
jgi:hypothetical protein